MKGALVGKPATIFCGTATQHGGPGTTIVIIHPTLPHLGRVIVGVLYAQEHLLLTMEKISGGASAHRGRWLSLAERKRIAFGH